MGDLFTSRRIWRLVGVLMLLLAGAVSATPDAKYDKPKWTEGNQPDKPKWTQKYHLDAPRWI